MGKKSGWYAPAHTLTFVPSPVRFPNFSPLSKFFFMKKLLFALPLLVFALLLSFCRKTTVQELTPQSKDNMAASFRVPCDITISADNVLNVLEICGIPQAFATKTCNTCDAIIPVPGTEFRGVIQFDDLDAPTKFSIRNNGAINTWVTLASGNVDGPVLIPAFGGCVTFSVDDNCNISH